MKKESHSSWMALLIHIETFLPMLPILAGLLALPQPDGMAMRVLSLLPGTSSRRCRFD